MVFLENDSFLSELTRFFQRSKTSGSLNITMKRYDGRTKPKPKSNRSEQSISHETVEYKCILRASLGNKKISTIVNQKDVNKFQMAYINVLKGNMDGLKKRDKKSAKGKSKATQ
ncbi:signal recognition particle 14 kDa protein [Octopus bimaculoides]|uniref:Signal recognition particle 14 kDa protein n=2 Tax=Octopus bimaculoides TaxID=37653 RepID=A0A0L8I6D2_OCTBM|nr:signal recognition particle 14 kDa protein [Octopus bimaculoides]|eukprot:XP_014790463.1 PREDICTED: signal recognition particle 14 kDa protein-like [Octopus bimaculoides]